MLVRGEPTVTSAKNQSTLDSIIALAEEIARASPECAVKAMQIIDLVTGLEGEPDQETVRDALDAEIGEGGLSDVSTQKAATAVIKATR
jgi:hypothetical protein